MSTSLFDSRLPCRVELVGSPVLPYPQVHLRQLPPPARTSCPVPARASRSQYRAPVFRDENVLLVANMITTDCTLAGYLDAIRPGPSMRSSPSSPLQVERSSVAASRVPSCLWHAQPSSGPRVVSHTVAAARVRASAHQALVSGVAQTPFRPHGCASSCCTALFPWHALRTGSDASVEDRRQRQRLKRRARISNPIEKRSTGSPSNTVSTSFTSSTRASTSCFPRPGNIFLCSGRRGWSSATSEHEASSSRFFAACLGVRANDSPVPDALCLPSRRYEANTSTLLQARRKRTRLALPSIAASGGNPANPAPALVYSPAADTSQA
ncbi:hypothetical protein ACCO45_011215 [Purpureocillium lilacinum]|uniref:Uncharacterized protein n=1 Tax=Purpureocillium lilacinum TaxID=33203 RepID=A0ACC4DII8_PURLI